MAPPPLYTHRTVQLQLAGQEGRDELEDGVTHAVQGGGGQLVVVVHVVAVTFRLQLERLSQDFAQDCRQELVVSDVLDHRGNDVSRLLEYGLVIPMRVNASQFASYPE